MKNWFDRSTRYYKYDGVNIIWQKAEKLLLIEQQTLRQLSKITLKQFNGYVTRVVAIHLNLVSLVNFDVLQGITELVLDNNWLTVKSFEDLKTPMQSVVTLSVNNNQIQNVEGFVRQLCEKFPNIFHLSCLCNLFENTNLLVKVLPGLQTLNGKTPELEPEPEQLPTKEEILDNQAQQQKLVALKFKRSSTSIHQEKLVESNAKQIEVIKATLQQRNDVLMESFLQKRTGKNKWCKRYCRLSANGKLCEFENDVLIEEIVFGEKQVSKSVKPRAFKIECNGEKHLYRALTDETFGVWLIKIEKWF